MDKPAIRAYTFLSLCIERTHCFKNPSPQPPPRRFGCSAWRACSIAWREAAAFPARRRPRSRRVRRRIVKFPAARRHLTSHPLALHRRNLPRTKRIPAATPKSQPSAKYAQPLKRPPSRRFRRLRSFIRMTHQAAVSPTGRKRSTSRRVRRASNPITASPIFRLGRQISRRCASPNASSRPLIRPTDKTEAELICAAAFS
jgi:hypothetical protein